MYEFDNYFEIFTVNHSTDKKFPILKNFDTSAEASIRALKSYFEEFWNIALEKIVNPKYEQKIEELKEEIENLEADNLQLENEVLYWENRNDNLEETILELQTK